MEINSCEKKKTKKDKKEKKSKQSKQASIPQNLLVAVNTMYPNWTTTEGRIPFPSRDKGDIRHLKNACNSLVVKKICWSFKKCSNKKKTTEPILIDMHGFDVLRQFLKGIQILVFFSW